MIRAAVQTDVDSMGFTIETTTDYTSMGLLPKVLTEVHSMGLELREDYVWEKRNFQPADGLYVYQ